MLNIKIEETEALVKELVTALRQTIKDVESEYNSAETYQYDTLNKAELLLCLPITKRPEDCRTSW